MLTIEQKRRFQDYCNRNNSLFSDLVVVDFFQKESHIMLLLNAIEGDTIIQKKLEEAFRKHFFRIRFIKFLTSTIKFCTINQLRLNQKIEQRNQLIFDCPASEKVDSKTLGELLLSKQELLPPDEITSDPEVFQSSFANEHLERAFVMLSHKQKKIATLGYSMCYQDNEIAKLLGITPQAVCKTRNLALQKLRVALPERR
jgi:RNA polymerase sigma factor (sigma-70 family)